MTNHPSVSSPSPSPAALGKSVPSFRRVSRGAIEERLAALFDGYCQRRWGAGRAANIKAARHFDVDCARTVQRWRSGQSALPAFPLAMAMTFEGIDRALDALVGPDIGG